MDQVKIGNFIKKVRKNKNMTQEELANILGVSNKSVSKWERALCLPDASLYNKLSEVLDISLDELFKGEYIPCKCSCHK